MATAPVLLKALGLVLFLGGIAAASYGVGLVVAPQAAVAPNTLRLDAIHPVLNATPGHAVTYAVVVANRGHLATVDVTVTGEGGLTGNATGVLVPAASNMTAFVTVQVPADLAVGRHPLVARATGDAGQVRERADLLELVVLPALPGFGEGSAVDLTYVGRIADSGQVFNTNDAPLARVNFPKFSTYGYSPGLFRVTAADQAIEGVWEGLQGLQAGESRTITMTPEKAYGGPTQNDTLARVDHVARDSNVTRERSVGRAAFNQYVNETDQGKGADYKVGDTFVIEDGPNKLPYRVTRIDAATVTYLFDAKIGDAFTIYRPWANSSVVVSVNDTTTVLRTTPTTNVGERFTMRTYWPQMSAVLDVTDTEITIEHSPPVGFRYTPTPTPQDPQPVEWTVRSLTADEILVTTPNTDPLGGRSLTFDLYAAAVTK